MKSLTKQILTAAACLAVGASGFWAVKSSVSLVSANDPQTEEIQDLKDKEMFKLTNIGLSQRLTAAVNDGLKNDVKMSQQQIDDYAYYAIQFWKNGSVVFSSGEVSSADDSTILLDKILELYAKNDLDPSYKYSDAGIEMLRKLKEPENYQTVHQEIQEDAEKILEEWSSENYDENEIIEMELSSDVDEKLSNEESTNENR